MKRLLVLVLAMSAILIAPVGFAVGPAGISAKANVALAVLPGPGGGGPTPKPTTAPTGGGGGGGNLTGTSGCVTVGLPVKAGDTCVSNSVGSGGAIVNYLRELLSLLSGAVGTVIVLMLIIAGIQYITSYGDPGNVKAAKQRIINAITALVLFMFMVAILQFLVPGGIL